MEINYKYMNISIKNLSPGVKKVILNDPKTYNSLSFQTLTSLLNTFKKLDKDNSTKVIILEGAGKGFSAGHNLKEVKGYKNKSNHLKLFNLSVADSGFDSWLDGYKAGSPDRKVSIYVLMCFPDFDNVLKTYTQSRLEFTLGKKFAEDLAHYKIRLYNCKRVQEICKEGLTKIKKLLIVIN